MKDGDVSFGPLRRAECTSDAASGTATLSCMSHTLPTKERERETVEGRENSSRRLARILSRQASKQAQIHYQPHAKSICPLETPTTSA